MKVNGHSSTYVGQLEESVHQIAELRTLEPGMKWSLTTDLDECRAASLFGRPTDEVDGIEINGAWRGLGYDEYGPLLQPDDWPEDSELLEMLFLQQEDEEYDWAFSFDRAGPLCRLWGSAMWESGDDPPVVYEQDDLIAVERLAPHLLSNAAGTLGRAWPAA